MHIPRWAAAARADVPHSGEQLSTAAFSPTGDAPTRPWIPAQVPGTVLGALVQNGDVPDPNVGVNSLQVMRRSFFSTLRRQKLTGTGNDVQVPDIGDTGPETYTYWFCVSFAVPDVPDSPSAVVRRDAEASAADRVMWLLELEGVNYSFQLFVNGSAVPVSDGKGMFLRHRIDLCDLIRTDGLNFMAILVFPPDHYGKIPPGGGQGGDHSLAADVASQFLQGWDWIIAVPDRATGIYGDIVLRRTGCIQLADACALTSLSQDALDALALNAMAPVTATISVSVTLVNQADVAMATQLSLQIAHEDDDDVVVIDIMVSEFVTLAAKSSVSYTFKPQQLTNAQLW